MFSVYFLKKKSKINIIVGGNNAGKSSILHSVQFLVSAAQTAKVYSPYTYHKSVEVAEEKGAPIKLSTSLSPKQLFYSPLEDPYKLGYYSDLTSSNNIFISFSDASGKVVEGTISKGRNRNILVELSGRLVKECASLEDLYSMYVPGISGISFNEEIRSVGAVRNVAAKGDSNTVFRNILRLLSKKEDNWGKFLNQINKIFPNLKIEISSNDDMQDM